jgi:hypothetical protein
MCATQMVAMGVDVVTGSARLGHSVPSTFTNMYAHGLSQTGKQAADSLGQLARGGSASSRLELVRDS